MILDKRCAVACAAALALVSCGSRDGSSPAGSSSRIVASCTISTLCSLVIDVAGSNVDVKGMVPVGASAETYEPTPGDMVTVSRARLLFENGNGLETWIDKVLTSAARPDLTRIVLAESVPASERVSGNPHLWLDPTYAARYVRAIEAALETADVANASTYRANSARELANVAKLDKWIRAEIATVPARNRAMICFHNAWYYFDRRYGIKNVGALEISPGQEPSAESFARLINLARQYHVRAVFAEPQFSPKLINELASSAGIRTVSNLYDDTLGTGPQLSNYDGMMRYDVDTIVKALQS